MYYKNEDLLLSILSEDPDQALSVADIRKCMKVRDVAFAFPEKSKHLKATLRNEQKEATAHQMAYRLLGELCTQGKIKHLGDQRVRVKRYYKIRTVTDLDLANEHKALQILLSSELLSNAYSDSLEVKDKSTGARKVANQALKMASDKINSVLESIQVVPDGISRLPVAINKKTISEIIRAIKEKKQVEIKFKPEYDGNRPREDVTPISLVIKDGAHYLIAALGKISKESLIAYALQRLESVTKLPTPSDIIEDDEMRETIKARIKTHFQYGYPIPVASFPLQAFPDMPVEKRSARLDIPEPEMIKLRLRVAPRAEFHFIERPLSPEQTLNFASGFNKELTDANPESWKILSVTLPYTVMLLPFILSYGPWVRVDGPATIKEQLEIVTKGLSDLYF
jgi:hypothetical protein